MNSDQRDALRADLPQEQIDAFGISNAIQRLFEQVRLSPADFAAQYGEEALLAVRVREHWHRFYSTGYALLAGEPDAPLVDNELETDKTINDLLGKDVGARFRFIMERAATAEELDV